MRNEVTITGLTTALNRIASLLSAVCFWLFCIFAMLGALLGVQCAK